MDEEEEESPEEEAGPFVPYQDREELSSWSDLQVRAGPFTQFHAWAKPQMKRQPLLPTQIMTSCILKPTCM